MCPPLVVFLDSCSLSLLGLTTDLRVSKFRKLHSVRSELWILTKSVGGNESRLKRFTGAGEW
jgi:hypothetical protein